MANYSIIDHNSNNYIINTVEGGYNNFNFNRNNIDLETSYQTLLDERAKASFSCDATNLKPGEEETDEDIVSFKNHLKVAQRFKGLKEKRADIVTQITELQTERDTISKAAEIARASSITFDGLLKKRIEVTGNTAAEYVSHVNSKLLDYCAIVDAKMDALQKMLDAIDTRLNILRTVVVAALEDTVEPGEIVRKKICAVCFENEVNMVSVPCGHTLCGDCVKSTGLDRFNPTTRSRYSRETERPKCPHCRTAVESVVKIFFSV